MTRSAGRRRWRVVMRDEHTAPARFPIDGRRAEIVAPCGLMAGLLTILLARDLTAAMSPMAMILVPTLVGLARRGSALRTHRTSPGRPR
jgi:hypothetical protein